MAIHPMLQRLAFEQFHGDEVPPISLPDFVNRTNIGMVQRRCSPRLADMYTGQCFANGEVNLVGNEAILAWHVQGGSWDGVPLQGLTVAAAVRANGTLGDPYEDPYPAKAVLLVDDQASPQQSAALVNFARHMGGELLKNVQQVVSAPMELVVNHEHNG